MYDQSFESAKAGGACGEAERGYEFVGGGVASSQFDAQHSGEAAHLRFGQVMLRMRREAGVIDSRDFRMTFQKPGQRHSVQVVSFDSQPQRPQPAQQQPAVERAEGGARDQGETPEAFDEVFRPDERSRRHVVMAADVLGRAVNDRVNAEFERPLIDGRRERVVADRDDASVFGQLDDEAQVGDLHQRVDGSFDVDQFRVRAYGGGEFGVAGLIYVSDLDAPSRQELFHQ